MYFNMQLLSYSQLHGYIIYGTDVATVNNLYSCIPLDCTVHAKWCIAQSRGHKQIGIPLCVLENEGVSECYTGAAFWFAKYSTIPNEQKFHICVERTLSLNVGCCGSLGLLTRVEHPLCVSRINSV